MTTKKPHPDQAEFTPEQRKKIREVHLLILKWQRDDAKLNVLKTSPQLIMSQPGVKNDLPEKLE